MIEKSDYRWHLRKVMASRGLYATTDLRPLLAERGLELSPSQVYRLVAERPVRLNLHVLMALIDILDCTIDDLIERVPGTRGRRTADATAVRRRGTEVGSGPQAP
ncbi:helix-turn-helix domain-containing protein [Nonomuraea sp. SYSU D8015]|uniref:helix-turn-helix domain-containing protein n=1 Tax=Nonomuraea sp. SYSU D8015 TaxID=2593644 RepID=UPI001CB74070|nr:helix-turn-helix transcriptional regulator [Nonomuraea sp. SYSU D8015]